MWQELCTILTHPASITQALEQAQGGQWLPQQLQARRTQLQRGQARLQSQVERLTDAYVNQVMPLEQYQRRRQAVEQHLHAVARWRDNSTNSTNSRRKRATSKTWPESCSPWKRCVRAGKRA